MHKFNTRQLALAAVVAALYTVLSYFANIFGLAFGPVQCRFSEALCVLPFFFPGTTWGLFIGCVLTNLMSAYGPIDIVFGSLATLLAAFATSKVKNKWLAPLPPVIANGVIVSAVIAYSEAGSLSAFFPLWAYNALTIAAGEVLACYVLGMLLLIALPKISFFRSMIPEDRLK
ncbi:MAG: QueT transporter family protein [Oscillospiraceae bacterium]